MDCRELREATKNRSSSAGTELEMIDRRYPIQINRMFMLKENLFFII
jgi:hypothetical protein